jgi:hypothetical protein
MKSNAPKQTKKISKPKKVVIDLQRERADGKHGIVGMLSHKGKHLAYTLELEWNDNAPRRSCIPAGEYEIKFKPWGGYYERYRRRFNDHGDGMLEITGVGGRSHILIHCGNRPKDTAGCVLVGTKADSNKSILYQSSLAYDASVYPYLRDLLRKGKVYIKIS